MRRFLTLFRREMTFYFHSPLAYIVLFFFLLITGFNFYSGVTMINRTPTQVTMVEAFFNTFFFWYCLVFIFPLITMRLFSEEYKMGTIEPLMTVPVRDIQVVLAKFAGALAFYIILWLPSLLYFVIFQWQTNWQAANAAGAYMGAYTMLLLIGMFYISVGCFTSALTRNQIVAAIICFVAITLMLFMGLLTLGSLAISPVLRDLTAYFSSVQHMMEFSQGIFDSRPFVFYPSMTIFMLFLTYHVFQRRRWTS